MWIIVKEVVEKQSSGRGHVEGQTDGEVKRGQMTPLRPLFNRPFQIQVDRVSGVRLTLSYDALGMKNITKCSSKANL